jgi:hypothetical protein
MINAQGQLDLQVWPIDRLVSYARNPRKNDAAVDRMCGSIDQFGFKIPVLARSDGEVIDGHLRLKAARKLGSWPGGDITGIPVILCDEWTDAQVRAFRLMVNRSVTWADWDEDLLAAELQELAAAGFDLNLTGFDSREIDDLLDLPGEENANAAPPVPENPVSRLGDLWICGKHRVLCGDSTQPQAVARLLGERQPILLVTDPPYGVELDSEWRDRAGLNGCGPAQACYMKHRTEGHTETTISGDTRADWSEAFELVPSLQIAYVWHASKFTREVLTGLLRIGFEHHQQIIWDKGRTVLTRTLYWFQHEPVLVCTQEERAMVRQGRRELHHLGVALAEIHYGRLRRAKVRSPDAEARGSNAASQPPKARRISLRALSRQRNHPGSCRTHRTRLLRH